MSFYGFDRTANVRRPRSARDMNCASAAPLAPVTNVLGSIPNPRGSTSVPASSPAPVAGLLGALIHIDSRN